MSEADRSVETAIRNAIHVQFPDDGIWGEEHGRIDSSSGFTWVIDPIDGTSAFLHGLQPSDNRSCKAHQPPAVRL